MSQDLEVMQSTKWQRVQALGQVAEAAKNCPAGHRVYLRAMTVLEIELGITNAKNAEVAEGHLVSVDSLMFKAEETEEDKVLLVETEEEKNK